LPVTLAADDTCYPLRGGLLRYINDGSSFPKLHHALAISADPDPDGEIIFIVPRNDNILIVGGFAEPEQWDLDYTIDSDIVRRMQERAVAFLPALKDAKLDSVYPFAQGLRPVRKGNVRLEKEKRDDGSSIVHCYGQGGSGWSFSFGCAVEVAGVVEGMVAKGGGTEV
jgi:D-amino-acid oxidase